MSQKSSVAKEVYGWDGDSDIKGGVGFSVSKPPLVGINAGVKGGGECTLEQLKWALEWVQWHWKDGDMRKHPPFKEPYRASSQKRRRMGKQIREYMAEHVEGGGR